MNGGDFLARNISAGLDKLMGIFGKYGAYAPVDDSKSGIKIGDKTYQVVVSLNGCYWYLDENGKKHPIADMPKDEYEWVNIAEKHLQHFKVCYRTLGGKVEVWSWYQLNDEMDVLKEKHRITDSTDVDNPIGTLLDKIPETWVMIDCDLPDMTERDVTPINRCYKTPGGKVEIEGLEAIDDKLGVRESIYSIIQSTDPDLEAGDTFNVIPKEWVRMVCDFPDMTERDVTYILECYTTPGGKVQIEGLRAIDNILDTRESVYTVIQSTDEGVVVGTVIEDIPEDWVRMVCDFPDMTDREIVEVDECYSTGNGKIQIKGYQSRDAILGIREQYYYVVNSTDQNYPVLTKLERIENSWTKTTCDFPDMTQRHIVKVDECYSTEGGKVHLGGYRMFDGTLGPRGRYFIVMETSDPSINKGNTMTSIPEEWEQIVCDFPDATTADTEVVENCYSTGAGKVQLRTYLTIDGNGKVRTSSHIVLKSTDASYKTGSELNEIPVVWTSIECDFASLTQRHIVPDKACFESASGKIYLEGNRLFDNNMKEELASYYVVESSDPAILVGSQLNSIPEGYNRIPCKCSCSEN